jgi:MSHA biogenesis protein MshL
MNHPSAYRILTDSMNLLLSSQGCQWCLFILLAGLSLGARIAAEPASSPTLSPRAAQNQPRRPLSRKAEWRALERQFDDLEWTTPDPSGAQPVPGLAAPATAALQNPDAVTPVPQRPEVPDQKLYSFTANGLDLKAALALFAQANELNIVPDSDVSGPVTLDLRNLPLSAVMRALLEASDYIWTEEGGLIRVRATETRNFALNYLQLQRRGIGHNSATLAAGTSGGGTSVLGAGGGAGVAGSVGAGNAAGGAGGSTVNLTAENSIDFWKELHEDIDRLLTSRGRETLAINPTAGIIQVTDRPSALKRVERYLDSLRNTVHRQVDIEARLYDVTLNDQFQFGIDWAQVVKTSGGAFGLAGAPIVAAPVGGFDLSPDTFTMTFNNANTSVIVRALQEQGEVKVISKPRIRTLNNQTALIKVGTEMPFFQNQSTIVPGGGTTSGTSAVIEQDVVTTVTVGTILAITPQVAEDDWITLDVSPVLTSLLETKLSPNRSTTAPVLDIKQASTLIRVPNGATIVMGGLIQTESAKHRRKIPGLGDIPWLGRLFQGDFDARRKKELIMFITPQVVK